MDSERWSVGVAIAVGVMAMLAPWAAGGSSRNEPLRAQEVVGREVLNSAGRESGWVEDLLVDIGARRIEALVVAHDGRSIKVPAAGARYVDDRVRLAQDERTLDAMRRWDGRVDGGLSRVKLLLGKPLKSREGDRAIGTVKELLVDLPGSRITHVVVDLLEGRKAGAGWIAVAADAVRPGSGGLRAAFDPAHLYVPGEASRAAAAAAPPPPRIVAEDVRLSRIVGKPVKSADGTLLGKVTAVHVDRAGSRIAALRVEQAGESYDCSIRADGLVLRRAAVESPGTAASLGSAAACRPAIGEAGVLRARELLKALILDPRGEVAGSIKEIAVDADTGKLHYLVGAFREGWVAPGYVVALPVRPLERHEGRLAIRAQLTELMQYPVFEEKRLADLWSPAFARGMDEYLQQAAR